MGPQSVGHRLGSRPECSIYGNLHYSHYRRLSITHDRYMFHISFTSSWVWNLSLRDPSSRRRQYMIDTLEPVRWIRETWSRRSRYFTHLITFDILHQYTYFTQDGYLRESCYRLCLVWNIFKVDDNNPTTRSVTLKVSNLKPGVKGGDVTPPLLMKGVSTTTALRFSTHLSCRIFTRRPRRPTSLDDVLAVCDELRGCSRLSSSKRSAVLTEWGTTTASSDRC